MRRLVAHVGLTQAALLVFRQRLAEVPLDLPHNLLTFPEQHTLQDFTPALALFFSFGVSFWVNAPPRAATLSSSFSVIAITGAGRSFFTGFSGAMALYFRCWSFSSR